MSPNLLKLGIIWGRGKCVQILIEIRVDFCPVSGNVRVFILFVGLSTQRAKYSETMYD